MASEEARFDDRVTTTKLAGPTLFSRGDTNRVSQRDEVMASSPAEAHLPTEELPAE